MEPQLLLIGYVTLRLLRHAIELALGGLNRAYCLDETRLAEAAHTLSIPPEALPAARAYFHDRQRFAVVSTTAGVVATVGFVAAGGLGWVERLVREALPQAGAVGVGLAFFAVLGLGSSLVAVPFAAWSSFFVEARHGFNRQTPRGFALDALKSFALSALLGGALVAALLFVMQAAAAAWWLVAWGVVVGFELLVAWAYPSLLAPLFNRFTPLPEGPLRAGIFALADRVGFRTSGVYVMDASQRTAHGNAYFAGMFGARRIVLFDTLLATLEDAETLAVLGHELGHFKLGHVPRSLLLSAATTGAFLGAVALLMHEPALYAAFGLGGPSPHGALAVFGLWAALPGFLLAPLRSALSRRFEFAADAFAVSSGLPAGDLRSALLKLREASRGLPLAHPLYSRVYHSHPPLVERLKVLESRASAGI